MSPPKWSGMEPMEFVKKVLEIALKSVVLTCLWCPAYFITCILVYLVQRTKPCYGKIMEYTDFAVEEKDKDVSPNYSINFTMVLDGPMELKELKALFTSNVLEAKIHNNKTGEDEPRFREYKQYQADFAGYRFWRDDEAFNVDNHILEEIYSERYSSLPRIHQEAANKPYLKNRSPWEVILVPKYKNQEGKSLLVYRSHHSLGDTKSLLKVLVEALGEKQLTLPEVQYPEENLLDKMKFYAFLPFFFVYVQVLDHFTELKGDDSIFKFKNKEEPLLHVGISEKFSMKVIKAIAKSHGVHTSSVIMAAMAGGVAKSDARHKLQDLPCQWVLPKPNHPVKLSGNYCYCASIDLPTTYTSAKERLKRCGEIFRQSRKSKLHIYDRCVLFQKATWFSPLRERFLQGGTFPLSLTNIAGEQEGFQIGGRNVLEHTMTCGLLPGAAGAIITAFSYKDMIELSATIKGSILTESQTQQLADLMTNEFHILRNISS